MYPKKRSESLSFRLGGPQLARLADEASARNLSPDLYARTLVVGVLQDEIRLQLIEENRALREDVRKLRGDISITLETILLNVAGVGPDEARAFVRDRLGR